MKNSGSESTEIGIPTGQPWKLRFWSIYFGQTLSLVGSSLTQFILMWWITDKTGSISALSIAGIAGLLPQAVLGPLGGVISDRYSRRCIMIVSDVFSAACMAVLICLFHTDSIELWHVYWMMALRSAATAFQQPAAMASVPMLVPKSFLVQANGLEQAMGGLLVVCGAPLGALMISLMPLKWALSIDVFTMLIGLLPIIVFTIPQRTSSTSQRNFFHDLRQGVQIVWGDLALRHTYALYTLTVLVVMPLFTLLPLLIKEHFSGGPPEIAYFESLAGIGMIIGGGIMSLIRPRRPVSWILLGFSGACLSIALAALMPGKMFWLSVAFWTLANFALVVGNAVFTTTLQLKIPNHVQGRAMSLMTTLAAIAAPLGLWLVTPLGEAMSTRWVYVFCGVLSGSLLLFGFLSRPIMSLNDSENSKVFRQPRNPGLGQPTPTGTERP